MSPPRVVGVGHHDANTWNLVPLGAAVTGVLPDVVEHDEISVADLQGFTHVLLSPGPGRPDEPRDFSLGRDVFEAGLPVLGVCLGMQGLVTSYGGRVDRVEPAHGLVAQVRHDGTGLFTGLPSPFDAVRYHSLAALALPDVLVADAWCDGPAGDVVMGVRHRTKPLWGVQFHPESILSEYGDRLVSNFLELTS